MDFNRSQKECRQMQAAAAELIRMAGPNASPDEVAMRLVTDLRYWGYIIRRCTSGPARRPIERFFSYVSPEPNTGCWLWTGSCSNGYAQFYVKRGAPQLAHRFAYEAFVGRIPRKLTLDHLCNQPSCVNPAHLEPVPKYENTRRMLEIRSLARAHAVQLAQEQKRKRAA